MLQVNIKGFHWQIELLDHPTYVESLGDTSAAIADRSLKKIYINEEYFNIKTVRHEIVHAFMDSLCLSSCENLSIEDYEEIVCEVIANHIIDIEKTSQYILKKLTKNEIIKKEGEAND